MKKASRILVFFFIFSLFAAMLTACAGKKEPAPSLPAAEEKAEAGYKAPDFETTLLSGAAFTLSEQTGKTVVLNFWATWCGYCVMEMPYFEELAGEYGESVRFIGVNTGESENKIKDFIEKKGFTFDIIADTDGTISQRYPTDAIPLTVIISPDGTIAEMVLGARTKDVWKEKINAAQNH